MVAVSENVMSKKKSKKPTSQKKKAIKKPTREKVCGEANKVIPLKEYIEKHELSQDTLWSKLLKKIGLYKQ